MKTEDLMCRNEAFFIWLGFLLAGAATGLEFLVWASWPAWAAWTYYAWSHAWRTR